MTDCIDPLGELRPFDRAVLVVWWLAHGSTFSTRQVAVMYGISDASAYRLMCSISQHAPIHDHRGRWRAMPEADTGKAP